MDNLHQHIIDLASTRFNLFGLRSVSIEDICSELRISKKTFYRFFPKKEDLIEAVLKHYTALIEKKYNKMCAGKNAIDALIVIIKDMKNHVNDEPNPFFYDLEKYYPDIYARFQEKQAAGIQENFANNLRQGIAEGYYREDLDVELSAIFHTLQLRNWYRDTVTYFPDITKNRLIEFYVNIIVRLITNEKGLNYVEEQIRLDKHLS